MADEVIEKNPDIDASLFEELIALKLADKAAQNPELATPAAAKIRQCQVIYQDITTTRPYRLSDLALSSDDVRKVNTTRRGDVVQLEGSAIDLALQKMLGHVLRHPEANNPEDLTNFLRANLKTIAHLDKQQHSIKGEKS